MRTGTSWQRPVLGLAAVTVLLIVALLMPAHRALAYFTDFEDFDIGQASETLTVPGMTFGPGWIVDDSSYYGSSRVTGLALFMYSGESPPYDAAQFGLPLIITFNTPQDGISFDALNYFPVLWSVTGFLGGVEVFYEEFMTGAFGYNGADATFSYAGETFDSVVIVVEDYFGAIDNIATTEPAAPPGTEEPTEPPPAECDTGDPNRVNNMPDKDCAAPVVIYCSGDAIDIYSVDPATGIGTPLFYVSAEEIAAVGVPTDENAVLAAYPPVILSRLTTGEFQLNTEDSEKNPYIVVWNGCPVTSMYHIEPLFE